MFFSKCWPRKIAKFCGFKSNFYTCFDPKYISRLHYRASKFSGGTCPRTPLGSSRLRPSISSLMEKFILVETSHEKCWIHPWTTNTSLTELRLVGPSQFKWHFVQFCTRRYYPLKYEVFSLKSFFLGEQEPWIKFAKIYKFSTSFINETVLAGGSAYWKFFFFSVLCLLHCILSSHIQCTQLNL